MNQNEKIIKNKYSDRLHWYHWLVVISSLVLTISAWYITSKLAKQKSATQFQFQSQQIIALVKERMNKYEDALWSGVAAIHSNPKDVNVNSWNKFSSALSIQSRHPGINGIGVIDYIKPKNLKEYLEFQQIDRPDYSIHPQHNNNEYWPITHVEPVDINKKAVGLDIAHESNRYTAAKQARDTASAQITGPIVLVQDSQQTPGFLFYVPYYNELSPPSLLEDKQSSFVGLVYAPFIMSNLMEGTLENQNRLINFDIHDEQVLLYDELKNSSLEFDPNPLFNKQQTINLYGRDWSFNLQSTKLFREQQNSSQPMMILVGGIIIDLMLLILFLLLTKSNRTAIEIADKMTAAYKSNEALLDTALNSSPTAFAIIDSGYKFIEVNQALCDWLGHQKNNIFETDLITLIEKEHKGSMYNSLSGILSGNISSAQLEIQFNNASGEQIWGLVNIAKIIPIQNESSNNSKIVLHITDINNEKLLLEEMKTKNAALERSNADLEQFAYIASHDLKSPIHSIQQLSSWIIEDCEKILPKESNEHLQLIVSRSVRLKTLLEDLLDYARVGRNHYNSECINLRTLINDQLDITSLPQNFQCEIDEAKLIVPRVPFELIMRNLISNIIKHHDKEEVKVKILYKLEDNLQIIKVKDDGPGIPLKMHKLIFEMFRTLKSRDEVEGSGMGLAMADRTIKHYGGDIKVKSDGIRGSTFIIVWPIQKVKNIQVA